jgi:hypothetical protein
MKVSLLVAPKMKRIHYGEKGSLISAIAGRTGCKVASEIKVVEVVGLPCTSNTSTPHLFFGS